jgi:hypothetical protein
MSEFVETLERDLLDAATRLQRQSAQAKPNSRRSHRFKLLGVLAAVLVVAAPALAGVPGIWRGVLAGSSAPTLTTRPPVEPLLAELGALRRPATSLDRSPDAAAALAQSGPLSAVSVSDIRYVGISPIGDPLYLVPYRSRGRLVPREGLGEAPTGKVMYNGHPPTAKQRVGLGAIRKHLQTFLNQPGACLIGISATSPEIDDCASAGDIAAGADYTTVGVYRVGREKPGGPAAKPGPGHVVASIASGIVPDHVAEVRLAFSIGRTVTIPVHENHFALMLSHGEGGTPDIRWLTSNGQTLRWIRAR